ncbi:Phosphinothricin N-acetyltransferase, partial [Dysosmobacter welbionis]
ADDALVLAQQIGGLGDVIDAHGAAGGIGFVNGLPCAGVHSGGVAKEHISALVDHGLGKLNALVGGGKVAGVDHIQSGDGFALLLSHIGGGFLESVILAQGGIQFHGANEGHRAALGHKTGQGTGDPAHLLGIGQQGGHIAVDGFGGSVLAAVQQGEGHIGELLRRLKDGVGVLVARGVDQVIAQVTIGDDGVIVGRLGDAVGD